MLIQNIISTQRILKLRIKSLIPTAEEKERPDLGGLHFFNGKDADKKIEKKVKGDNIDFDISDVKDAIDTRLRPLEKKVSEIKKDVVKLRADIKDKMQILHVQLCRDFRLIIRDELRGIKDVGDKQVDSDSDDDSESDEGGDVDDDDEADEANEADDVVDEDADVFKGNYNDDDEVGDDGLKADEKNDEFENEVVKECEVDVMVEDRHVVEDVDDGSKLNKNNDGDDVSDFVEKNDGNEIEYANEVGRDVMVEEHHEIIINDDQENVKIANNDDMPTFDILSQCTEKEIVVYVAAEAMTRRWHEEARESNSDIFWTKIRKKMKGGKIEGLLTPS